MTRTLTLPEPIAEIFRQVERLERAYPGRKFTPDGHLIGSIGEVIAAEAFDLKLLPASAAVVTVPSELCSEWLISLITGNLQGKSSKLAFRRRILHIITASFHMVSHRFP